MSRFTGKLKESSRQESLGRSCLALLGAAEEDAGDGRGAQWGGREGMLSAKKWKAPGASVNDR